MMAFEFWAGLAMTAVGGLWTLAVAIFRGAHKAGQLEATVKMSTAAINGLRKESRAIVQELKQETKDEFRVVHARIDRHEERMGRLEVDTGSRDYDR